MRLLVLAMLALALPALAEEKLAGRWEGLVQIPGRELPVVIDLAKNNAGQWQGSVTFPDLRITGAELNNISQNANEISFASKTALADQKTGPATFKAHLQDDDHLAGEFVQGGNTAPFTLTRSGVAQIVAPPQSTRITQALEGEWHGQYELLGYRRKVTLKLQNQPKASATAEFVIVGKKTNNIPVDFVRQENDFITVDSHEMGLTFEGRVVGREIRGMVLQGPIEVAVTLHHE